MVNFVIQFTKNFLFSFSKFEILIEVLIELLFVQADWIWLSNAARSPSKGGNRDEKLLDGIGRNVFHFEKR